VVVEIETDLLWEFRELEKQEEYDALEHWYPFLNPLVHGLERARKAVVLSLVSGADDCRRKRIHVLLTGGGVAKCFGCGFEWKVCCG